ncbi:ABC transporter ATP-binding protein [Paraburkholderia caballeronis]|uniref:ABC transporter ATP-binding protein n=1 Tax=Paraburkholderia caballeronis TaxID=416943 RepID=UPI0010EEB441|nr:ABC transporter ATP-binding protein [Paraburkholderia caballeronis]TDV05486.1 putative spermidine/putrescine transport system ATP-binding protein [Paraburkholderia caballeronis]TDV09113.1 putative spermidine/putrescine transport system ATP-binding protein [Paraburkholderia caballeronis]TDV20233.1 putative spermidine/putrescine transport system ATP-binding protein [Paraburkholderia caballeronis]TDV33893.1 putative spermidine/putrescine transport system ATP-binding protein [Paraburkholderia ca
MSHLQLVGVSKHYGAVQAVIDAVLDVQDGEFVSLLGPSGSGKTSTLMMIAGFEEPTAGSILLGGKRVENVPPNQRDIGMVFQSYALFPHLSIADNVAFPLKVRKWKRADIDAAVRRVLALVGLEDKAERLPKQLSGGQQQRVALARALVYEPKLLLLDEPLSALDKNMREQMQIELRRIHRQVGITTLYVTHDQSEAMTLSDRIVVFNHGRIEQVGTPLDVYARPVSRFAASFIGDSNLFDGRRGAQPDELIADGGLTLRTSCALPSGAADAACALVRPEDIRIGAAPDGASVNAASAQISSVLNMGSSVLVIARQPGHPARELRIQTSVAALAGAGEGATIPLWWTSASTWPIPADAARH